MQQVSKICKLIVIVTKSYLVAVVCMNNDVVEMTVNIVQTSISHDLSEDGWTKGIVLNWTTKQNFTSFVKLVRTKRDPIIGPSYAL